MPRINDLNLNNWKEKLLIIFGDKYKIKKTYDIDELGFGIYGFEIYNEDGKFLKYFGAIENIKLLKIYLKQAFYKNLYAKTILRKATI